MITRSNPIRIASLALLGLSASLQAQVHYQPNGSPWTQRAPSGPDAEVPGWFYNLGITGLRAQLVAAEPKALLVKYVFPKSPACGLVEAEDRIIGAGGRLFRNEHRNGYGPIAQITAQGALAYAMMHRCGIKIDRAHHDAAYDFLKKATGPNGYVWYKDEINGGPDGWADMGRTGAAGIANILSPYPDPAYRERALLHSKVIGEHPQSFPDTHGSPVMGMCFTALTANIVPENFRKLMDANRWWFTLAQCADGSFYYQPNRDNAGYGPDARMTATAAAAFIFTIPKHSLVLTGKAISPAKP